MRSAAYSAKAGRVKVDQALAIAALTRTSSLCAVDEHEGRPLLVMEKVDRRPHLPNEPQPRRPARPV